MRKGEIDKHIFLATHGRLIVYLCVFKYHILNVIKT